MPPLFHAYNAGLLDELSFSLYLDSDINSDKSSLILGGYSSEFDKDDFDFHPMVADTYYMIDFLGIAMDGEEMLGNHS